MANPFLVLGGIAVGIVVATMGVLQVPGWVESAQDAAAKNDLANIRAAEAAHASKFGGFTSDLTALRDAENLGLTFESSGGVGWTGLAANETGWCASVLSGSGKFISASSASTDFAEGRDAAASVAAANCAPELVSDTIAGAPEPGAGGPGGGLPASGASEQTHSATFVFNCPTTTSVNLPFYRTAGTATWSDGTTQAIDDSTEALPEKTLAAGVEYTVNFDGTFEELSTSNLNNSDALECFRRMDSWHENSGTVYAPGAFRDMVNLTAVPSYLPSTVEVTSEMFAGATSFNHPNITRWDTGGVVEMTQMFEDAVAFNQPIGYWDTSSVEAMDYMFDSAASFNQPIGNWDTSSVTNIEGAFMEATDFNQSLSGWDTSNVTEMYGTFRDATAFNGAVGSWDVRQVLRMNDMFNGASSFNQNIAAWAPAEVQWVDRMFLGATAFQQDLSGWVAPKTTGIQNFAPSLPSQFHPSWPALGL